jgi:hypothetical protein
MDLLSLARTVKDRVEEPITDVLAAARIVTDPRTPLLLALSTLVVTPLYRASFLASAAGSGVLQCLAVRPCDLDSLAEYLEVPDDRRRLRAWLDIGVRLGEFDMREGCYRLKSTTAKLLAQVGNDAVAATLEEIMRFHVPVLLDAPRMLKTGRGFSLDDQDGPVIARSSLALQGFVQEAIGKTLERDRPVRLLEIGCGTGTYVRHAAELNPRLTALAVDLQKDVAVQAADNMARWGLTDRVETRQEICGSSNSSPSSTSSPSTTTSTTSLRASGSRYWSALGPSSRPAADCCSPRRARAAATSASTCSTSGSSTPTSAARCPRRTS